MAFHKLFKDWFFAKSLANSIGKKANSLSIYFDYKKKKYIYGVTRKQYKENRLYALSNEEQKTICSRIKQDNELVNLWVKDRFKTRKFLSKYMSYRYETSLRLIRKRQRAYTNYFGFGKNCRVQYGVDICREHHLFGTISVGNNVFFAKHVFIDYSGEVVIEDGAKFGAGVSIETHHRDIEAYNRGEDVNIPTRLLIREGAYIGTHATILDSCNYIGKCARIGAGAVVVKDIPDYCVAVGVPAKVVKTIDH